MSIVIDNCTKAKLNGNKMDTGQLCSVKYYYQPELDMYDVTL